MNRIRVFATLILNFHSDGAHGRYPFAVEFRGLAGRTEQPFGMTRIACFLAMSSIDIQSRMKHDIQSSHSFLHLGAEFPSSSRNAVFMVIQVSQQS